MKARTLFSMFILAVFTIIILPISIPHARSGPLYEPVISASQSLETIPIYRYPFIHKYVDADQEFYNEPTDVVRKFAFGDRTGISLTSALTISLSPPATMTIYTLTADTNVTFNATTTRAIIGDIVFFKVTAHTRNRIMVFGDNLNSLSDTITAGITKTYQFIYTGSDYDLIAPVKTYVFGGRTSVALTSALTISLSPPATMTIYTLTADTNVTFTAATTHSEIGDMIVLKVKGNTRNRTMVFSTNLKSVTDIITATKTMMYEFIYTGAAYCLVAKAATD